MDTPNPTTDSTLPRLDEQVSRLALLRLISVQLQLAGFSHVADTVVLEDLESLAIGLLEGLVQLAHELAQLGRRSKLNIRDVITACEDQGISLPDMEEAMKDAPEQLHGLDMTIPLAPSSNGPDITSAFLPSDIESDDDMGNLGVGVKKVKQRSLKRRKISAETVGGWSHLPDLPPRHTWKNTIVRAPPTSTLTTTSASAPTLSPTVPKLPPPQTPHPTMTNPTSNPLPSITTPNPNPNHPPSLPLLDRRILNNRSVESALRDLIKRTGGGGGDEDHHREPDVVQKRVYEGLDGEVDVDVDVDGEVGVVNFEREWYGKRRGIGRKRKGGKGAGPVGGI